MTKNNRSTFCSIPKPILVLAGLATICLLANQLRSVFNECHMVNSSTRIHLQEQQNSTHSISRFQVSYSKKKLPLYIYSAFLDTRFSKKVVRVFGIEHKDGTGEKFSCRWSVVDEVSGEHIFHEVAAKRFWIDNSWPDWSLYFACEYSCNLPTSAPDINSITLRNEDGDISFNIQVEQLKTSDHRKDLAVCVKPTSGFIGTNHVLEWAEMLKAVGYTDVIIYDADINGPGRHVIDYYVQTGFASVIRFPYLMSVILLIDHQSKLTPQERFGAYEQIYLVGVQDCLYRMSADFRYVTVLDMDQIVIPTAQESVLKMLHRAESLNPYAGGFTFMTSWHFEDMKVQSDQSKQLESTNQMPENLEQNIYVNLLMQQFSHGSEPIDKQSKSFISTDRTITMNLYEVLDVAQKDFHSITLPKEKFGITHHFWGRCSQKFDFLLCESMKKSTVNYKSVTRYKDDVQESCNTIANHFQLL